MMIHINLLPVRQVKKREASRQFLVLAAGLVVIALLGNYAWYHGRQVIVEDNEKHIQATNTQIHELEKVIGEVNNINKRKKEVEAKLKVLDDLRKRRSGPVRMMDALATAIPKKVWIATFDEKNGGVKLTGKAFSHDDVADFMRSLGNIVWTPKGMGRIIDQRADAKATRVELLANAGAIEEFPVADVSPFFTAVQLKRATQGGTASAPGGGALVTFEINLNANYAI